MKLTEQAAIKILKDMQLNEDMDDLFTQALTALEEYDYGSAYIYAKEVSNKSKCIEQRCAALMVMTIASEYDKTKVDTFLNKIYSNL